MLFITTDKIKYGTVGASFTVTFTVAPEEINYLMDLHEKYMEMNMKGFKLPETFVTGLSMEDDKPVVPSYTSTWTSTDELDELVIKGSKQ